MQARSHILLDSGWRFHFASQPALRNPTSITEWRWRLDPRGRADAARIADPDLDDSGGDWQSARTGEDIFKGTNGTAWFRTRLPRASSEALTLRFDRVDDNATVYLNGKELLSHQGFGDRFDVPLDAAWKPGGPNVLAVLVQNTSGPGGITRPVTLGTPVRDAAGDPSQPRFDDRAWKVVHLPDDYGVRQRFTHSAPAGHASLPTPMAWYRKKFWLPASDRGRSLWLTFDGVYRDAQVYLNGHELGEHPSGYTGFHLDISRFAHFGGANDLAVHVDPRLFEGWWYEGGGIYRHVWLTVAGRVHVAPWGTGVGASLPEPRPGRAPARAAVEIRTTLSNEGPGATCQLVSAVLDEAGRTVARVSTPVTLPGGQTWQVLQRVTVLQPRLWSLETPHLYRVRQVVERGSRAVDDTSTVFGIRTLRFDPDTGFYLNGLHVEIKGTANHQDFAGVGIAVPDSLEYWRVKRLKEMGCNAWRTAHNPPTPSLLDACDRLGMLVMDENRHMGSVYTAKTPPGSPYSDLSDLASMVERDRNHPSIIFWSLANEEPLQGTPEGARMFRAMMDVVHRYDRTRPITSAMNAGLFQPGFRTVEDLAGINYNTRSYDRFHQSYPTMPMFGSETTNTKSTRGVYANDPAAGWVSSYNLPDADWAAIAERPFMAGSFTWTGFDYKGEPNPYGWPDINNNTGLMDICGFPKEKYYYFRAWWNAKPELHLIPHWSWPGKEGQPIRVLALSNCERVELFLNGTSLGSRVVPRYHYAEWSVPYAPGELVARGYNGAGLVATDRVETTGSPWAIRLRAVRTRLTADGEDVEPVEVDVVDRLGRVVPVANNLIRFSVEGAGRVAGVGNGNPADHDPDHANYRRAFHGLCMALVGAGDTPGPIVLTAVSPGIESAVLRLHASAAP